LSAKLLFSSISIIIIRITKNVPVCKKVHKLKKETIYFENCSPRRALRRFLIFRLISVTARRQAVFSN